MDDAMRRFWTAILHPHRLSDISKPLSEGDDCTRNLRRAKRDFDDAFDEFQRERERWRNGE